jgi:zinc D-Ala-D-Ala carboxypeptidase
MGIVLLTQTRYTRCMKSILIYTSIIILGAVSFSISKHITLSLVGTDTRSIAYVQTASVVPLSVLPDKNDMPPISDIPVVLKAEKKSPCPQPIKKYADMTYLNVDQDTALSDTTYIPSDLMPLDKSISTSFICLTKDAYDQISILITDAAKENLSIKVTSGFRSYDTQAYLLKQNLKNKKVKISTSVAKPGYSEHQLGIALDLTSESIANKSASSLFGNTPEAKWLEDNAYLYGFIESYPEGKKDITGYIYEPWHYRYVGKDMAKEIHDKNITINEYLELNKNTTTQ